MKIRILAGLPLMVLLLSCSCQPAAGQKGSFYDVSALGPQVLPFTTEQAAQELAKTHTVVYFFTATWCFECQETYRDVQANLKAIPSDFTLIYVNYDQESILKQKYGVTVQHTFVLVGTQGERKKIWVGTIPIVDIVAIAKRK